MFSIARAIFPNLETPRHGGEENREAGSVYEDVCRGRPSSAAHRGEMPGRHDQSCGVHRAQDCESTERDICGHVHNRLMPYGDIIYSSWLSQSRTAARHQQAFILLLWGNLPPYIPSLPDEVAVWVKGCEGTKGPNIQWPLTQAVVPILKSAMGFCCLKIDLGPPLAPFWQIASIWVH